MALVSPGVEVTVINESQYATGGSGTVPLIVMATEQDKLIPGSTTIAPGTTKDQANKLYLLTSQSEVVSTFGSPIFKETEEGNVIQGGELNEYGLWTGFNYLGAMNRAYFIRADVDLKSLEVQATEPTAPVLNGTYWVDADSTSFGIRKANGSSNKSQGWDIVEPVLTSTEPTSGIPETVYVYYNDLGEIKYYEALDNGVTEIIGSSNWNTDKNSIISADLTTWATWTDTFDVSVDGSPAVTVTATTNIADTANAFNTAFPSGEIVASVYNTNYIRIEYTGSSTVTITQTTTNDGDYELDGSFTTTTLSYVTNTTFPASTNAGDIIINTVPVAGGFDADSKQYNANTDSWIDRFDALGYSLPQVEQRLVDLTVGDVGFVHDLSEGTIDTFVLTSVSNPFELQYVDGDGSGEVLEITYFDGNSIVTKTATVSGTGSDLVASIYGALSDAQVTVETYSKTSGETGVRLTHSLGRTFEFSGTAVTGNIVVSNGNPNWTSVSNVNFYFSTSEPTLPTADGTVWYDQRLYADVLICGGPDDYWHGMGTTEASTLLENQFGVTPTATPEVQHSVLEPSTRIDGSALSAGDIWINVSDLAEYEYSIFDGTVWSQLDPTDQSTTNGILFGSLRSIDLSGSESDIEGRIDAAKNQSVSQADDLTGNVPDPEAYPAGMIAINVRATGNTVKVFDANAEDIIVFGEDVNGDLVVDQTDITDQIGTTPSIARSTGEWDLYSGLHLDGRLRTGHVAQRQPVVEALQSTIVSTTELRAETVDYSLILTPGYFECLDEMVNLNIDRKETSYIITDVPARLSPQAGEVNNWAKNANNAATNGSEGRLTSYDYAAQYYGWGIGTTLEGKEAAIPPSAIALRTYAYNDSVSYVWFPPAGFTRGLVSNASSTGFINSEGEYQPAILDQGQRDTLYENNINPITFRPGRGLVVYGDKSLSPIASALDRVNVGRLVVHVRKNVAKIMEKYLFELNTSRIRGAAQGDVSSFLSQILEKEGLYDFSVVCDSSNNTPARIDANELWVDVYIQPTKSINFIYVPIRIQNTGA